ncbi:hypothetical protein RAS1_24490 [Phycisphaerae bacterium RAS1]|nr:hypothetical protein RAS1_24490 [Phycisphaerae bacterium RAS1]
MIPLALFALFAGDPLPEPLQKMLSARDAVKTAEIEWTVIDGAGATPAQIRNYRAVFGIEGYFLEDQGDAQGVVARTADGQIEPLYGQNPLRWLWVDGELWEHRERSLKVDVHQARNDFIDARSFGLGAALTARDVTASLRAGNLQASSERVEDGLFKATVRDGAQRLEWLISQRAGWSPVRARVFHDDVLRAEATIENDRIDGVWFPRRITFVHFLEDGQPRGDQTLEIRRAAFNKPSHAARLTPEYLKLETGTNIELLAPSPYGQRISVEPLLAWDGKQRVPNDEVVRRVRAGELKYSPAFQAEVDRLLSRGQIHNSFESRWRDIVERFIKANRLDAEQTQRARLILQDCLEQARAYVARQQPSFATIDATWNTASSKPAGEVRPDEFERLRQQVVNLEAPIHEIHREQLTPRLRALLTREQLSALEARRAETAPAVPAPTAPAPASSAPRQRDPRE